MFGHNLTMLHGGLAGGPGYLSLLDDDEVLADLSRGHPDKSSTQLVYPCLDLEVHGRSGQSRLGGREKAAEFVAACRLRRELGLPRHVFVKVPGEPKPVYVDWQTPLLVRQVCRLAARQDGTLEISEMLPTPGQRWLRVRGRRYTSELRCAVFSPGGPR